MTVYGLEKAGQIRDIEIHKQVNAHSVCKVTLLLNDNMQLLQLQDLIGKEVSVEDDEQIFMRGFVNTVSGREDYARTIAVVTIISFSRRTDKMPMNRIFQDTRKTYAHILAALVKTGTGIQAVDSEFAQKMEPKTVVQYNETDFAFAVRMANENGCDVFVNDTSVVCMLNVGKSSSRSEKMVKSRDILSLSWNNDGETESMEVRLRGYYELGALLKVENRTYVVVSSKILFHNGAADCCYGLRRELNANHFTEGIGQTYYVGLAKVTDNQDPDSLGRIQVEFVDIEDSLPSNKVWIPYLPLLTEKDGGQVLIPDKGETVHIVVENGKCYADGCVRQAPLGPQSRDVNARTLNVRGQFVSFTDQSVKVKSLGYELTIEDGGIHIVGEGADIKIEKDSLSAEYKGTRLKLAAKGALLEGKRLELQGDKIEARTGALDIIG